MKFLVMSSRLPFALDEIRKLGQEGHEVIASDTFRAAPGNHSRYASSWHVTASPLYETRRFMSDVERLLRTERVDLVLPAFEEAIHLARHADELSSLAPMFMPSFETLVRLHSKVLLQDLAKELSVAVPSTIVASSQAELVDATRRIDRYLARPEYSRGGVDLLTNAGALAGALSAGECHPTAQNPWIVQEYIEGVDICSYSIAHHGRVTGHSAYVHPREIEHSGGIVFESVPCEDTLEIARRFAEKTGYHGQISFDFKRTARGLVLIECNPRPTAGVFMMSPRMFVDALLNRCPGTVLLAPAGERFKISSALVRNMLLHPRELREDLAALLSDARDVYAEPGDRMPALYQVLSYAHVLGYRLRGLNGGRAKTALVAGYLHDICWNGE